MYNYYNISKCCLTSSLEYCTDIEYDQINMLKYQQAIVLMSIIKVRIQLYY